MLTEQSKNDFSKVQSVNDISTVVLPDPMMSEILHSQNQPTSMDGMDEGSERGAEMDLVNNQEVFYDQIDAR